MEFLPKIILKRTNEPNALKLRIWSPLSPILNWFFILDNGNPIGIQPFGSNSEGGFIFFLEKGRKIINKKQEI